MKPKKSGKKLRLNKKTIAALNDGKMDHILAGIAPPTLNTVCMTVCGITTCVIYCATEGETCGYTCGTCRPKCQ